MCSRHGEPEVYEQLWNRTGESTLQSKNKTLPNDRCWEQRTELGPVVFFILFMDFPEASGGEQKKCDIFSAF